MSQGQVKNKPSGGGSIVSVPSQLILHSYNPALETDTSAHTPPSRSSAISRIFVSGPRSQTVQVPGQAADEPRCSIRARIQANLISLRRTGCVMTAGSVAAILFDGVQLIKLNHVLRNESTPYPWRLVKIVLAEGPARGAADLLL